MKKYMNKYMNKEMQEGIIIKKNTFVLNELKNNSGSQFFCNDICSYTGKFDSHMLYSYSFTKLSLEEIREKKSVVVNFYIEYNSEPAMRHFCYFFGNVHIISPQEVEITLEDRSLEGGYYSHMYLYSYEYENEIGTIYFVGTGRSKKTLGIYYKVLYADGSRSDEHIFEPPAAPADLAPIDLNKIEKSEIVFSIQYLDRALCEYAYFEDFVLMEERIPILVEK